VATFEGRTSGLNERLSVKLECHGEAVKVVKILHATICDAQFDDGLELFGDDGFARVSKQARSRQFKECRVLCIDRARCYDIAEADIDLYWDSGFVQNGRAWAPSAIQFGPQLPPVRRED